MTPSDLLEAFLVDPASVGAAADLFLDVAGAVTGTGAGAGAATRCFSFKSNNISEMNFLTFRVVWQLPCGLQDQTGSQFFHRLDIHRHLIGILRLMRKVLLKSSTCFEDTL